ncbi:MAG: 4Fe-4S dicluster domain-containing protein [Vicinamibacterales bacterium]|jgi:molybdopterin-containing oxidoreductase family iron-sulfur binding subunit|nr:4Fe-4S dicluster domain-containing protein [Vicinamibacterales bacterium]
MARYGMVVDLKRCVGCNACVVACKSEHNTPNSVLFTTVLEKEMGTFPQCNRVFVPVLCNHCDVPVCAQVCPTKATHKRPDGIVFIEYAKCIGCCACIEHCPYHVRTLVQDPRMLYPDGTTAFEKPVAQQILNKVATKCDLCYHRVETGQRPACVEVCPTKARVFGDLADPSSEANRLVKDHGGWQMLPEKQTQPCVFYIG